MTPLEKLASARSKQMTGRFIRVESVKDGAVVVSDVFDLSKMTMTQIENRVTHRTLALVVPPFHIRLSDVSAVQSGVGFAPTPYRTLGG